jgi:2-polyprenyl-3-methyl-5-hydroxy-6-metoxy-1,4-benzoquinol methylase
MTQDPHMNIRDLYTSDYYNTLREEYITDSPWKKNRVANVMHLTGNLEMKDATVMDMACGIGTFTVELYRKGALAIGLDYTFNAMAVSQKLFLETTEQEGIFITADALSLPFADCSFEIIICADFIEHISQREYEKLVTECWRALKPNGSLVIYTPNRWHFLELMMRYNIFLKRDESHIDIKTMKRVVTPLNDAGFRIVKSYYRPTHINLLRSIETIFMHVPLIGELFRRRICVLAAKRPDFRASTPSP